MLAQRQIKYVIVLLCEYVYPNELNGFFYFFIFSLKGRGRDGLSYKPMLLLRMTRCYIIDMHGNACCVVLFHKLHRLLFFSLFFSLSYFHCSQSP